MSRSKDMADRTVDDDITWWSVDPEEEIDLLLRHLTDLDIRGLGDSYDDGRIDTLVEAYIGLRDLVRRDVDRGLSAP
jgi:hypothetical protein